MKILDLFWKRSTHVSRLFYGSFAMGKSSINPATNEYKNLIIQKQQFVSSFLRCTLPTCCAPLLPPPSSAPPPPLPRRHCPRLAAPPPVCFRLSFCVRLPLFVGVMMSYEWGVCRIMTRVGRGQHTSTSVRRRAVTSMDTSPPRGVRVLEKKRGGCLAQAFLTCADAGVCP